MSKNFPSSAPSNSNGTSKLYVNGSPEDGASNDGGPKGAKMLGSKSDASYGRVKTYKSSIKSLNTGAMESLGGKTNISNRGDM